MKDLVTIFPVLRDWLAEFLRQNNQMTASDIGHNQLVEQVFDTRKISNDFLSFWFFYFWFLVFGFFY